MTRTPHACRPLLSERGAGSATHSDFIGAKLEHGKRAELVGSSWICEIWLLARKSCCRPVLTAPMPSMEVISLYERSRSVRLTSGPTGGIFFSRLSLRTSSWSWNQRRRREAHGCEAA